LIVAAFKAYEEDDRKISAEKFRWALTKWGDKFSAAEVDDIFGEFEIDDDGFLDGKAVCGLFVAGGGEEKKEEVKFRNLKQEKYSDWKDLSPSSVYLQEKAEAKEEAAGDAAAPEEGGDDGGKKKKKKKKAAK
jgi:hypothetical protein